MIMLFISFDGLSYTVPVNPEELKIQQKATNSNIDIIGLGKATRKGEPGLKTLKIKSFFPNPKSRYYMNIPASTYIEFIRKIWNTEDKNNKVATISSHGIKNEIASEEINMPFVIEQFDYSYQGGDFDTAYELSIKEYVPYGVGVIEDFSEGMQSARLPSTVKENVPGIMEDTQPTTGAKTYTISSGDTLWSIAKRSTGSGNNWQALYELNKDVIGANPNKIYSGATLTLPENWNSPTAKINVSTSSSVKASASNNSKNTTLNNSTASTSTAKDLYEQAHSQYKEWSDYVKEHNTYMKVLASYKTIIESDTGIPTRKTAGEYVLAYDTLLFSNSYNNAVKKSTDKSKTPEERIKALKEIREYEQELAKKLKNPHRYNEYVANEVNKLIKK